MLLKVSEVHSHVAGQATGRRMLGVSSIILGDFAAARTHLEKVISFPNIDTQPQAAFLFAMDPWLTARNWLTWPLLITGYPDQADARDQDGLILARRRGHPISLAQVQFCSCAFRQLRGDSNKVRELASELCTLAAEQNFPFWAAMGEVFDSWALSQAGDANLAVARIKASLAAYRATGGELWQPYFLALVADCLRAVGQMKDAGHCIVEALTRAAATGERWFEAELLRLRSEGRGPA
jgi:predicted ATPase